VVTHVDSAVPYVRIQHVDTRRGPLDRVAGVTAVVVFTAGSRGADVTVPGLDPERARALQRRLRERAVESGAGDAV
jgi:membrane protein YdbS with pleckstrin-like domain